MSAERVLAGAASGGMTELWGAILGGGPDPRFSVGRQLLQTAYNPVILAQFILDKNNLKTDTLTTIFNLVSPDGKPKLELYKDPTKNVLQKPDMGALAYIWQQFSTITNNEVLAQRMQESLITYRDAYIKFYRPILDNFRLDTADGLASAIVVSAMTQVAFPEKPPVQTTKPPPIATARGQAVPSELVGSPGPSFSAPKKGEVFGRMGTLVEPVSNIVLRKPLVFPQDWAQNMVRQGIVTSAFLDSGVLAIFALFSVKDSDYVDPNGKKFTASDKQFISQLIFKAAKEFMKGSENDMSREDAVLYGQAVEQLKTYVPDFTRKLENLKNDSVAKPMLSLLFRVTTAVGQGSLITPIMIKKT